MVQARAEFFWKRLTNLSISVANFPYLWAVREEWWLLIVSVSILLLLSGLRVGGVKNYCIYQRIPKKAFLR